jgi:hypothetical protein
MVTMTTLVNQNDNKSTCDSLTGTISYCLAFERETHVPQEIQHIVLQMSSGSNN